MHATFEDRREAGRRLARALADQGYHEDGLLVLGIPRGGVPVADEVARALHAPLDVVISRKLRAPYQPELAIGAVTSGDHVLFINEEVAEAAGATREYLEREIRHQQEEIDRRLRAFRGDRPPPELKGRTVIVVDDGIATGSTFRAALEGLRRQGPGRLVAAIPVGPPESVAALRTLADDVVCLETPELFWAVGAWYQDFTQTTDEDVVAILKENWTRAERPLPATAPELESSAPLVRVG
jgi:putative phosphoribosyl transferase